MTPGRGRGSCASYRASPYKSYTENASKNLCLLTQAYIRKNKNKVMMTELESTKLVNCMTTGTGVLVLEIGHISHIVNIHFFFTIYLLHSQAQIRQTIIKYIVMLIK